MSEVPGWTEYAKENPLATWAEYYNKYMGKEYVEVTTESGGTVFYPKDIYEQRFGSPRKTPTKTTTTVPMHTEKTVYADPIIPHFETPDRDRSADLTEIMGKKGLEKTDTGWQTSPPARTNPVETSTMQTATTPKTNLPTNIPPHPYPPDHIYWDAQGYGPEAIYPKTHIYWDVPGRTYPNGNGNGNGNGAGDGNMLPLLLIGAMLLM